MPVGFPASHKANKRQLQTIGKTKLQTHSSRNSSAVAGAAMAVGLQQQAGERSHQQRMNEARSEARLFRGWSACQGRLASSATGKWANALASRMTERLPTAITGTALPSSRFCS